MTEDREPNAWCQCPVGTVKQMVGQIRLDQRREFLRTLAKGSAAVLLLGAGGVVTAQWMLKEEGQAKGQLACSDVMELLPDYVAHRLEDGVSDQVATHLAKCPPCRAHYEELC